MSAYDFNADLSENETYNVLNSSVSRVGDFSPFYVVIGICTFILASLILLNVGCCCSRYSDYWLDRHTGNRWLVSIWSATPYKQPPLDLHELEVQIQDVQYVYTIERDLEATRSVSHQPLTSSQEYLELHKRESDI